MRKALSITSSLLMAFGFMMLAVSLLWIVKRPSNAETAGIPTGIALGIAALVLSWALRKATAKLGR